MADIQEQPLFDDLVINQAAAVSKETTDKYLEIERQTLQLRRDELNFKIKVAEDIKDFLYKVLEEAQRD